MHWHPFFAHFPIALLIASAIGWWLFLFYQKQTFRDWAFWNHVMGLIGLGLAVISGNLDISGTIEGERAQSLFNTHQTLGYVILWAYGMLLIWLYIRIEKMNFKEKVLFGVIFTLSLIGVLITGYIGGQMVYEEGIGVQAYSSLHTFSKNSGIGIFQHKGLINLGVSSRL